MFYLFLCRFKRKRHGAGVAWMKMDGHPLPKRTRARIRLGRSFRIFATQTYRCFIYRGPVPLKRGAELD